MQIQRMDVGDIAAIAAIEACVFSSWNYQQIVDELQRKHGLPLVALTPDGVVQAWCCASQVGNDAELLKITVHPERQRVGIGNNLLQALCLFLAQQQVAQLFLEVRSQNHSAIKLYAKLGFREIGRRNNYYKKPADDAVIFVRRLNSTID